MPDLSDMSTRAHVQPTTERLDRPPQFNPTRLPEVPGIPTDDPAAALEFCRSLARLLAHNGFSGASEPARQAGGDGNGCLASATDKPILSIVIPVYNEQENILPLYDRLCKTLAGVEPDFELVFVDDGSQDNSLPLMRQIVERDRRVTAVELARNFGHQVAVSAGLDHARGTAVVVMDADLQDPPEVLPQFIAKWKEGYDVVYAVREHRKESWFKRTAYSLFYRLLQRIANIEIPLDSGDFCIMDRRVVDLLVGMPERNRFVRGIRSWLGLNQVGLLYERQARNAGKPKYTMSRLIYLALDGLVSFSFVPLRTISILGIGVSVLSILLAIIYAIQKLTMGLSPPGFATTVVAIFFLAGIQLITIGVIGEYVGRIFEEVKRRPLYIVRQVQRGHRDAHPHAQ